MSSAIWLALEAATPVGSVAVGEGANLLAEIVLGRQSRHSEHLLPAVSDALALAGVTRRDVARIIVGEGPGSFTGVRIAAATAKGLSRGLGVPLCTCSSLAAVAAAAWPHEFAVCAVFDARRDEVYAACYEFGGGAWTELVAPVVLPLEDAIQAGLAHGARFAGDGALKFRGMIEAAGGATASPLQAAPRASALLWLASVRGGSREVRSADWEPIYLRPSAAERSRTG